MKIRNRIVETRTVLARDLVPNPKNWRRHPKAQADALKGVLREIGNADALLARELPDKRLMLVDGHLRADIMPDQKVTVLVLDLNEEEADKLLLTLDPLGAMATADNERLNELLETVRSNDPAFLILLDEIRAKEGLLLQQLDTLSDPEPHIDKADELRRKYGTANGQLWHVGLTESFAVIPVIRRQSAGYGIPLRNFARSGVTRPTASTTRPRIRC
jgi:hypothetical protein